jgi:hypothetical protein
MKLRKIGKQRKTIEEEDEEEHCEVKAKKQINEILKLVWIVVKITVIIILIFPFLDKLRHKNLLTKFTDLVSEYDIGCSPCYCSCNNTNGNLTKIPEEPKTTGNLA